MKKKRLFYQLNLSFVNLFEIERKLSFYNKGNRLRKGLRKRLPITKIYYVGKGDKKYLSMVRSKNIIFSKFLKKKRGIIDEI